MYTCVTIHPYVFFYICILSMYVFLLFRNAIVHDTDGDQENEMLMIKCERAKKKICTLLLSGLRDPDSRRMNDKVIISIYIHVYTYLMYGYIKYYL
jgi:hypothetical protein